MTPPLDARAKRSQRALLKAGLELLNNNSEATLSDIAEHAGVGRTTLYRQFETRENLVSAIAIYCLERVDEVTAPIEERATSGMDAVRLLFELAMPMTQELNFLMQLDEIVESNPGVVAISRKQDQQVFSLVESGLSRGEFDSTLPVTWIVRLIEGLFYLGWQQQTEDGTSADEVARLAFETFKRTVSKA
ncbi:MAG: TetR/AcrR family transcriptional regulator [Pseudomonadota bacterium]